MAETGRVAWFNVERGYGFIQRSTGGDVFVHYSKILAEPGIFRVLEPNDKVEFETFLAERNGGEKTLQAKNVRVLEA